MTKAEAAKDLKTMFTATSVDAWLATVSVVPEQHVAAYIDYINSLSPINPHPDERPLYE